MRKPTFDLEAVSLALLFATRQLVRRLRLESATDDVSLTQMAIMRRLATQGPATIADLARAEMISPQSMGSSISSLEEQGIVARQAHPTDGRQYMFDLTQAGIEAFAATASLRRAWLTAAMSALSPTEQETLAKAAALISRLADA
jgi:DNA-binding MarR family transcriptional regulator